jgi:hypothetical protein
VRRAEEPPVGGIEDPPIGATGPDSNGGMVVEPRVFSLRMQPSHASLRLRPRATTRCWVLAAIVLIGGLAPAIARADDNDPLAGLADQIEATVSQQADAATAAAQASTGDVAQTVEQTVAQATQQTVRAAAASSRAAPPGDVTRTLAAAGPAADVAGAADDAAGATPPRAGASVAATSRDRGRHRPARPEAEVRGTGWPVEPAAPPASTWHAVPAKPRETARDAPGAKSTPAERTKRKSRAPLFPLRFPHLPLPSETASSSGVGFGAGTLLPPLLVALTGIFGIFVFVVVIGVVPAHRLPRPRRIHLPPWRPG